MTDAGNVAEFFDSYAEGFNAIYGNRNTLVNRVVNKFFRVSMRLRFEKTLAGCHPIEGRSVVDIGTGPGHYAVALAKSGAGRVLGLDFAEGMIDVAKRNAERCGVSDVCDFVYGDFLKYDFQERFDYAVVMGFMDYIADARQCIDRVLSITKGKAFFSFPAAGGALAWQRQRRYRTRCDLYLYDEAKLRSVFQGVAASDVSIERIARDYFVTAVVGADDQSTRQSESATVGGAS
jgi:2-polyprenyl-3-methyl-5-hydroxy-6-metoxy-1,4-benzoquinol methylase